jgi:hypothetical protein
MAALAEYLRSHVAWCAAGGSQNVKLLFIHDSAEPKVCDKQICIILWCPEKQILWLEVAMHNAMVMEVCYSRQCSSNEIGSVGFVVGAFSADAVEELSSEREISHEINLRSDMSAVVAHRYIARA